MAATKAVKKEHWYEVTYVECVLCGQTDTYRERRYTPRPKEGKDRIHYEQKACEGHFM